MKTLSLLVALTGLLLVTATAQALPTTTHTAIPAESTYKYQQVDWGNGAGFEAVGFDDSSWSTGQAGFGSSGVCGFPVNTAWDFGTELLLRKTFTLPAGATNLNVTGTVDNDVVVYVNGTEIGSHFDGFCNTGGINITAPDSVLADGGNLLAVRAHDDGVGSAFIDQVVTYDLPVYSVCLLYDTAKSHKSGSTVPLKIRLCDENGNNLSSAGIVVHATGLSKVDSVASPAVEDSGNANPGDDFRYDATLGGYIFNKSTKGLGSGTWKLRFTVDGVSQSGYELRFDVR